MASLSTTLASIRRAESGTFRGEYNNDNNGALGAYGITSHNWKALSRMAGLAGANIRSKGAQDAVVANVIQGYYNRYGSWDIAVAAWYGGTKSADIIVRRGGSIRNAQLARLVKQVSRYQKVPDVNNYTLKVGAGAGAKRGNKGWTFPIAGEYEFSGGSFMDKHTKGDRSHHAIDIYAKSGTAVVSPSGGTITKVSEGGKLGGITVTVQGNDGVTYYFAHMSKHAKGITKGQKIMAGHQLGFVGNTGSARGTKAHLHFSMKKGGKAINPYQSLRQAEADGGIMSMPMDITGGADMAAPVDPNAITDQPGPGMLDNLMSSAAGMIAGGQRLDPRKWIDPDREELEIGKEALDGSLANGE